MNQYYKSSDYYPDDKDLFDFLSATGAPLNEMRRFLHDSGVICSPANSKQEIQDYLSYLYLSWPRAVTLIDLVNTREEEEPLIPAEIPVATDFAHLKTAIEKVRKRRGDKEKEVYELNFSSNEIDVSVIYIELDTSKTRVMQKRQKDVKIWIQHTTDLLKISYTSNNHIAEAIVTNFLGELAELDKAAASKLNPSYISFSKVNAATKRVQFFKDIMNGIKGFDLRNVTQMKVGKMPQTNSVDDDDEDSEEVAEAQNTVSKMVLYGNGLFATPEFQELIGKGFFITSASWKAEVIDDAGSQVEFTAGFSDPDECRKFAFKVLGKYPMENGIMRSTREKLPPSSVKEYTRRLVESSKLAYANAIT